MIFSHEFRMMAQEGHLASTSLLAGFEALAKIDYDKPGTVYSTLSLLATGLERTMKIGFILDYKARNGLKNPTDKHLRKLGHSITDLYDKMREAALPRSITDGWFEKSSEHGEIITILSEFSRASRYYNTDQLTNGRDDPDPLHRWFAVHMRVAESVFSYRRLSVIMERAQRYCDARKLFGWEMGPKGQYDLTVDVTYQLEVARLSRGHCVWTIVEILKPIYSLIDRLTQEVHEIEMRERIDNLTVPYMVEFFPFCLADKATAVRRKSWTTLFHIAGRV
ncbi:hypothetical protein M0208_15980 [Sphingomonas sp. SUN019]|uniref:hypothetical protein n=1 Tax=Sphingomonas sp. SUN019 TaxID=2937788 RepID=UPI002164426D|nr:hypothetical protein [Sphingomonas sp. SUN019]UVO51935.1 hypothetical protein M0208_15980 [Sphingomonas sp. SUN019]